MSSTGIPIKAKRPSLEEIREFRRGLRALEREIELSLASQTDCCGVTSAQCHILLELEASGASSVGELAEALELDPSTMSRNADSLVKAGLLSRADDPANRRRQILDLSSEGREMTESINALCDDYYRGILEGAGSERSPLLTESVAYLAAAIRVRRKRDIACASARGSARTGSSA
jgi:DNA-binding MarR family transcriptional regulator